MAVVLGIAATRRRPGARCILLLLFEGAPEVAVLTFGDLAQPAIPPGALMLSDPVDMPVPNLADFVVEIYLLDDTAAARSPVTYP